MSQKPEYDGDFRVAMRKPVAIRVGDDDDAPFHRGTLNVLASDGIECSAELPEVAFGTEVTLRLTVPEWVVVPRRLDLPAVLEQRNGASCAFRFRPFDEKLAKRFDAYARRARSAQKKLQSSQGATSALAEAFRMVQVHLEPANGHGPRVLLITSSVSGEGKSFLAAGLAVVLANEGKRVLLVDADLYRPGLHEAFGLKPVSGVARLLARGSQVQLHDLITEASPGLSVLTGGRGSEVPHELYAPKSVEKLLKLLRVGEFDVVILDSPPLLETAGAISLARAADDVMLAVRSRKSRLREVRQTKALLERNRVQLRGVVLTDYIGRDRSYTHGYVPRVDDRAASPSPGYEDEHLNRTREDVLDPAFHVGQPPSSSRVP